MKKVIVFGTFDIIHPGHIHMLKEAKEYGDNLVVIIARDTTVCEIKKVPSLNSENVRLENIKKLNIADKVRLGCLDDKYQSIKEEQPDIVALGYDQKAFVDNLSDAIPKNCRIVRLVPFKPDVYKSSKLKNK